MKAKKMTISIKTPKPRDFNHYALQLKGLMRTKVIKNKKKEIKKFNWKKDSTDYSNIILVSA